MSVAAGPRIAAALAVAIAALSCSSSPPESRAYLLGERPAPAKSPTRDLPAIRVRPLAARSFLEAREIAWRQGDVLAGAYRYHRWSEPPAEMVTRELIDSLRDGGRFAAVDTTAPRATAPLTLSGELLGLHEVAEADGSKPRAVMELEVTLEAEAEGNAPARHWTLRERRSVDAADDTIDALVRALSQAAAEVIAAIAKEVEEAAASARG